MKVNIGKIIDDLFAIIFWFLVFMCAILAFSTAFALPRLGVCVILASIIMTCLPKIINKFEHKEES